MSYDQIFVRDPKICGGETVIAGTRVTVRTILASLAEGVTTEEIPPGLSVPNGCRYTGCDLFCGIHGNR